MIYMMLTRWIHRFPTLISLAIIFSAIICLIYTHQNLTFKTSRNALIRDDLPYNVRYEAYRNEFKDFDGIIVAIDTAHPKQSQMMIESLAQRLAQDSEMFSETFYKIETSFFNQHALLYLKLDKLQNVFQKIHEHQSFIQLIQDSPNLIGFYKALNLQVSQALISHLSDSLLGPNQTTQEDPKEPINIDFIIQALQDLQTILIYQQKPMFPNLWKTFFSENHSALKSAGYLLSENEKLMFLITEPEDQEGNSFTNSEHALTRLRWHIQELQEIYPQVQAGVTGSEALNTDEMLTVQKDIINASLISLFGVAFIFILSFRGFIRPILAIITLLISIFWTMGFTTLVVGHLNLLSVVFTTILIGLGIDFGIHYLFRFKEEHNVHQNLEYCMQQTLKTTGKGIFVSALTTAFAFYAAALSDLKGLQELGMIAGTGIILCFIAMFTFLPASIAVLEKYGNYHAKMNTTKVFHFPQWLQIFLKPKIIFPLTAFMTILALFFIPTIHFNYSLLDLQSKDVESVTWEKKIIQESDRSTWYTASIANNLQQAQDLIHHFKTVEGVEKIESISNLIPENQNEKINWILKNKSSIIDILPTQDIVVQSNFDLKLLLRELQKLKFKLRSDSDKWNPDQKPDDNQLALAQYLLSDMIESIQNSSDILSNSFLKIYEKELIQSFNQEIQILHANLIPTPINTHNLPQNLKDRFIGKTGKILIQIYSKFNIFDYQKMSQFIQSLRNIDPDVTGVAIQIFESSQIMKIGYIKGGVFALIVIYLILWFTFRNLISSLLAMVPLVIGCLWSIFFMYVFQIEFNLANLVVLPLIIGIGVDNGIHVVHRFRESQITAFQVVSGSTGKAIILSSITSMIGFGSMTVAHHQGIYSIGLVLTLGIGTCLWVSITFLPVLLEWLHQKGVQL